MKKKKGGLVYSSTQGKMCPGCSQPVSNCKCSNDAAPEGDGIVRLRRSTSGRKGKAVIVITGVPLPVPELKQLATRLKQKCGVGGTIKNGVIEIQGEKLDQVRGLLKGEGFKVKG